MENLAALVVRLGQIRVEFGDEVALRAIHAASVAAAQIVLAEAEADARVNSAFTAEIIAFPLPVRAEAQHDQEPTM